MRYTSGMREVKVGVEEGLAVETPLETTALTLVGGARGAVRPQPQGGYLQTGGMAGRAMTHPTKEYKQWCQDAAMNPAVRQRIEKELVESGVFPVKLWELLMERGYGKVPMVMTEDRAITITVSHEKPGA